MEALEKRRETDQRVQTIVTKNLGYISQKLSPKGVIEYLFEKRVLTREDYEQLQIDLGRVTKSEVNIKLFIDILFRKENYWINTVKAIRTSEPQSSVADLIESVLPDSDKKTLERWYTRYGIKTKEEDSNFSSVTDSDVDTSSRVVTDRDYNTKKNLYLGRPGRPGTVFKRNRRSKYRISNGVKGVEGPAHRKQGHKQGDIGKTHNLQNVNNDSSYWSLKESDKGEYETINKDTLPKKISMLDIPWTEILPIPSEGVRNESTSDPRTGTAKETGGNRNGEDRNHFETFRQLMSVNIDTDQPQSSSDTDSRETDETTESEAESIEMVPRITPSSSARPSAQDGSAHKGNPPQAPRDVPCFQQQMPSGEISTFDSTPLVPSVGFIPTLTNPQEATQSDQQIQLQQSAKVTSLTNSIKCPEVKDNTTNTEQQQQLDSSLAAASKYPESQKEQQRTSTKCQPTETKSNPEEQSETLISRAFEIIKIEEIPPKDSQSRTLSENTKIESLGSKDSQRDAQSIKDTNPETVSSTVTLTEATSLKGNQPEAKSSIADKPTQVEYGQNTNTGCEVRVPK